MNLHCRNDLSQGYNPLKYNFGVKWVSNFMTLARHHLSIRRKTNIKKHHHISVVYLKLETITFIVFLNLLIPIFHRLKLRTVLMRQNPLQKKPVQVKRLPLKLVMRVTAQASHNQYFKLFFSHA